MFNCQRYLVLYKSHDFASLLLLCEEDILTFLSAICTTVKCIPQKEVLPYDWLTMILYDLNSWFLIEVTTRHNLKLNNASDWPQAYIKSYWGAKLWENMAPLKNHLFDPLQILLLFRKEFIFLMEENLFFNDAISPFPGSRLTVCCGLTPSLSMGQSFLSLECTIDFLVWLLKLMCADIFKPNACLE